MHSCMQFIRKPIKTNNHEKALKNCTSLKLQKKLASLSQRFQATCFLLIRNYRWTLGNKKLKDVCKMRETLLKSNVQTKLSALGGILGFKSQSCQSAVCAFSSSKTSARTVATLSVNTGIRLNKPESA